MDYKLRIIFLFLFINYSYNLEKEPIQYKINIIDNEMLSKHIIPVNNEEDGYLYIITGENLEDSSEPKDSYKRYILKFDMNSGGLVGENFFNSLYPFKNPESTKAGYFSEYLLTTTEYSIDIFNSTYFKEEFYNMTSARRTLKNVDTEYYYAYTSDENKMIIKKLELVIQNSYNNVPFYNIIATSDPVSIISHQGMISCDFTLDNKYILCAYITQDKNFAISVHNKNLELIQTEKKEVCQNFDTNYFIKIIYFKENNKFITMNSINNYITRLRFFRYIDGNFINQLYPFLDNNDQYLDVDETQLNGYNYNMDIIAVDSDKIIKVFASSDQIIITIFQFYEYETLLFIKIYNMRGYNYRGYNYFLQPRLSMFRDSMVVCLSTFYNNAHRAGYFFINYPSSIDINLTSSNEIITIKDLISIDNNLFSLDLKLKVLNVPKDLIFINLNGTEIKESDILELNDELVLRQYRIKEGPYKLEYEGIALGNDLQYSLSKVYPSYRDIPAASEIIIEGKKSNIIIDLDDCLEGYYHLDLDYNICTNLKPEGYYIDEKNKTFKVCESPCRECSGPIINETYMNCITCMKGFKITEDTNSCYEGLPENYYLDNDIFKRCYYRCNKCFNGSDDNSTMNCLSCISNEYFYRKDTFNCILKNETNGTDIIEIKSSILVYLLFVVILISSILLSAIFLYCYHYKVQNQIIENNKKDKAKEEQEKLIKNNSQERQIYDINENNESLNISQTELIEKDSINI